MMTNKIYFLRHTQKQLHTTRKYTENKQTLDFMVDLLILVVRLLERAERHRKIDKRKTRIQWDRLVEKWKEK